MAHRGLTFGIFLAPFHRVGENPTLALARDLELIEWLDRLGYDEAWIGEHHSAGWEMIASPEVVHRRGRRADAPHQARHRRDSLPYHHPLMVANRIVQLDHLTRGRAMLGVGPGALVSDAYMLGIEPVTQRPRMDEALDVIMAAAPLRGARDHEDRLVRAARGAAAPGALHRAPPADRRGQHHHAGGRHGRGQARRGRPVARRRLARRPRGPGRAVEDRRGDRGQHGKTMDRRSGASSSTSTWRRTTSWPCARWPRPSGTRP